jgi:hypothetical protein
MSASPLRASLLLAALVLASGCAHDLVEPPGAMTDLGFDAFHRANALEVAIANVTSDLPNVSIGIVPGSGDPVDTTLSWIVRGALAARGTDCLVFPTGSESKETEKRLVVWAVVLGGEEYRSFLFPPGPWLAYVGTILGLFEPTGFLETPFEVAYWIQVQTWAVRQLLSVSYEARGARTILRAELWDTKSGKLEWSREVEGISGRKNDL